MPINESGLEISLTLLCWNVVNRYDCLLALRELLFFPALVAPLVDLYFADVERSSELALLLDRPLRVLLERSLKNADFYFREAVTMLYRARLAAEVYDGFLFFVCLLGHLSFLLSLV